jgi:AraC family transcriptional regulator
MPISSSAHSEVRGAISAPAGLLSVSAPGKNPFHPAYAFRGFKPGEAASAIKIDLPYMDVVLSLSAEAMDSLTSASKFAMPITQDAASSDPVMKRLFDQLDRSESGDDDDGLYADAFRLAIVARWLKLRSHEQQSVDGLQIWRLKRVLAYIDEHIGEAISLADLAQTANLSRMYFAARFRAATGLRPHDYILRRRVDRAKELLVQGDASLVQIALDVGFQTQAHFTTVFKRFVGTTPGRWRAAIEQFA